MFVKRKVLALLVLALPLCVAAAPCERIMSAPDKWATSSVDELVRASRTAYEDDDEQETYEDVIGALFHTVRRCRLDEDAGFSERYRKFLDYVTEASLAVQPGHALGLNVPDIQYFAETSKFHEIPEYLLTPGFLHDVSRFETLPQAKKYLRGLNLSRSANDQLIFFSYTSRHLGTPDNNDSYRRLLVVVPGDVSAGEPDKWVQFGVTDPGVKKRTRNVSVVAALPAGDSTYNAYFKDNFRIYRRDGSIGIKGRLELGEGDENCASCHKTGVLPIFPEAGSVAKGEEPLVDVVNERFRSYGSPRFGGYLDPAKLGPGLSFASEQERKQRFGEQFPDTAVGEAMECSRCHTPEKLGYLNWPMDRIIIDSFITGGEMPRGHELGKKQRHQLYDKLIEEYFAVGHDRPGILKTWLLGRADLEGAPAISYR
jgi:hypothetical protein